MIVVVEEKVLYICESVFRGASTKLIDNQNITTKMKIQLTCFSRLLCVVILSFGFVLTSCEDGFLGNGENTEQGGNDAISNAAGGVTLTVMLRNLTETGVVFYGEAVLAENYTASSFGILYSEEEIFTAANAQSLQIVDIYGTNYSVSASSLKPSTTYYYTSYIKQGDLYKYGEIKSFTTSSLVAPILDEAADVTEISATISGIVSLAAGTASDLEYGFQYSITEDFSSGVTLKKITDINSENNFSLPIASLVPATVYYYRSYIKMNGVYGYGEIKSFTTTGAIPVVPSGYTNLSARTTANCYIISQSGSYCILVAKGNQPSELLPLTNSASLLWESFGTSTIPSIGDLIKSVSYKDGYIAFKTADTFKEGNAVIAAKDANGNILWSWHIWLTDQPQRQVYYNNAGTMMDRNLGATSATPGDVGALGLLYQWGRKDPFLGSSSIHYDSMAEAKSTITWPSAVSSDSNYDTIAYSIANPTTFITGNWYYTGSSSTDNTRWTTSDKSKSIYDPCPAGWRVPDGGSNGVWSKAKGSSSYFDYSYNPTNEGIDFSGIFGSASTIWYPASGYLGLGAGSLYGVGSYGSYWSASSDSLSACRLDFSFYGGVKPSDSFGRASGFSVRCHRE